MTPVEFTIRGKVWRVQPVGWKPKPPTKAEREMDARAQRFVEKNRDVLKALAEC